MDKHLHIICHDVPWPADYGGVMDSFHLLPYLHEAGIQIYLHCFTKNRPPQNELEKYCKEVHYYRRRTFCLPSSTLPYIVKSRGSKTLLKELEKNNFPILMHGIHCTYLVNQNKLPNRKLLLRPFNVENIYYRQLAASETNLFKKYFFLRESRLLEVYEKNIAGKLPVLAVSKADKHFFENQNAKADFIPVIIPWQEMCIQPGTGNYCLYQGNLSVNENQRAVEWLMSEVFNKLPVPIIIAGKNPNRKLKALISSHKNAKLIANPTEQEMQELIKNAQINLAPSFNHTGVKLKILHALYHGRHCIANTQAIEGSGIESLVTVANGAEAMIKSITALMDKTMSEDQIQQRSAVLQEVYHNKKNTEKIITWIY